MASRYPSANVIDYCFRPLHIVDETKDILVPCGKCDGCLLHKANEWSMRVGMEIEATPNSIFFTLTYNNKYIPKLHIHHSFVDKQGNVRYALEFAKENNVRFNSVEDVPRISFTKDVVDFIYCHSDDFHPLQNYPDSSYTSYADKRDVQLWLKLLRKDLINTFHFDERTTKIGLFRYFIISEYGPTTYRHHIHGIIFPRNKEIAEYLIECGLYKNWQMCDKDRFQRFTHYCDSGARNYLTNYITGFSTLPNYIKFNKEIKPFRLSSKSPAIGYVKMEDEKIFQDVSVGVIEYRRDIQRLGESVTLQYPKNYLRRLFPKCYRYSEFDLYGILNVYGRLFYSVTRCRYRYSDVTLWLRAFCKPVDYYCALSCFRFCTKYGVRPEFYVYLLDMYLYKSAMCSLRYMYEYQEKFLCRKPNESDVVSFIRSFYVNGTSFFQESESLYGHNDYVAMIWLEGFRIDDVDVILKSPFTRYDFSDFKVYQTEVEDIVMNCVKVAKFNELTGNSPHSV